MHHPIILVLMILHIVLINSIAVSHLHLGWRIDADASSVRYNALMMNLALVDTLITTAAHVGNLARREALASHHLLLRRVRYTTVHGLVDRRGGLVVDVLAAEAQRIVGNILTGARGSLVRAAGDEARRLLLPVNAPLGTIILKLLFFIAAALIHSLRCLRVIQVLLGYVLRDAEDELTRLLHCFLIAMHVLSRCIGR